MRHVRYSLLLLALIPGLAGCGATLGAELLQQPKLLCDASPKARPNCIDGVKLTITIPINL